VVPLRLAVPYYACCTMPVSTDLDSRARVDADRRHEADPIVPDVVDFGRHISDSAGTQRHLPFGANAALLAPFIVGHSE